jgi:TPR repeat protein
MGAHTGLGVLEASTHDNVTGAFYHFSVASEAGNADAHYHIAQLYKEGKGTKREAIGRRSHTPARQ